MLRFRWLVAAILLAAVTVFVACSGSGASTGIPPITGIVIRAETLTTGRGCGRGPTQVFKYAAVVYGYTEGPFDVKGSYNTPVTANVYDCYADGTFVELQPEKDSLTYRLEVFVFNEAAYLAARDRIDVAASASTREAAAVVAQGLATTNPTWTTVCTATQQRDVQTLAVCDPLVTGFAPSSIILRTGAFSRTDGGVTSCTRTPTDGGADAGDDGGDAGDAGEDAEVDADVDAGDDAGVDAGTADPAAGFATVRVSATSNGQPVAASTDIACPQTFVIPNATPGAPYELDVTLLDDKAALVGSTKCKAQAVSGVETAATCAPVQ